MDDLVGEGMQRSETDAPARSEECHSPMMGRGDAALGDEIAPEADVQPGASQEARGCAQIREIAPEADVQPGASQEALRLRADSRDGSRGGRAARRAWGCAQIRETAPQADVQPGAS